MGVPMILDLIIGSSWQSCCNFGPPKENESAALLFWGKKIETLKV